MTQSDATAASTEPNAAAPVDDSGELIANPDKGYRLKHLVMAVLLIAGGLWFAYDGWIKWPQQNTRIHQAEQEKAAAQDAGDTAKVEALTRELASMSEHTDMDILIQKLLAFSLPALGIFWGAWTLRDTRGQLRMAGDTLEVPGHPPVTPADIRRIDKRKWDRKGIAYLHYDHAGQGAVLKLDDFAYERKPTDAILERIERRIGTAPSHAATAPSDQQS